jgi:predicted deacylase
MYWACTKTGGVLGHTPQAWRAFMMPQGGSLLTVISPQVADMVEKGDFVASVVDIFGFMCDEYFAPETGVIVGKSTNPANYQGVYPLCHELNVFPVRIWRSVPWQNTVCIISHQTCFL